MSNTKRVAFNLLCSLGAQLIIIVLGLVVPRITMLGYGSEINGLLNSVTQFVAYLTLFETGIQAVAIQSLYNPIKMGAKDDINQILSAVHITYKKTGIFYMVTLVIMSAIYPLIAKVAESYLVVFIVVLFSGLGNVLLFFVQGKYKVLLYAEGKNYILTNIQTIITILNNLTKIILLSCGCNVAIVIIATFFVSFIQAIYISYYIRKKYNWIDLSQKPKYEALSQRNSALAHQISGLIFQNTGILILTIFCDLKVVSVYSIYKMITGHISSFLNIPFASFNFALGQQYSVDKKRFIQNLDIVEVCFSVFSFTVYTVALCLLAPFIKLYTRGIVDINYNAPYLVYLFIAVEVISLMRIPMLNAINYAGHFQKTLLRTIIESAINLVVSLVAVQSIGIYGVLIGSLCAIIYRTMDVIIYSNTKILTRKPFKTFKTYIADMAILFIIYIMYSAINIRVESYISFVLVGVILTLISLIIYFMVNFIVNRKEITFIINILKNKFIKSKNLEDEK